MDNQTENIVKAVEKKQTVVPYIPFSGGESLQTVIPVNMAFEAGEALNKIITQYGNIDQYLINKLKYKNQDMLYSYLAAEQIDGIALAIYQMELGKSLIIADQTGIGKGRQAASIIRYAKILGLVPVFITVKDNLFSAMYRDLVATGSEDYVPLMLNTDCEITDQNNISIFKSPTTNSELKKIIGGKVGLPDGYDVVMLTYSTLTSAIHSAEVVKNSKRTGKVLEPKASEFKYDFVKNLAENAVFILDESHVVGGQDTIAGQIFMEFLKSCKAATYLSATYAKEPKSLPIYAPKTSINDANLSSDQLTSVFERGGLPLQEIVASDLVKVGQLIRRQRSEDGIVNIFKTLEDPGNEQQITCDLVTEIMRDIVTFEAAYITPLIKEQSQNAKSDGSKLEMPTKDLGVSKANYFSGVFNIHSQLLFSLKVKQVAKEIVKELNQNRKVVVAFTNTMAVLLNDENYMAGDTPEIPNFTKSLKKGLERTLNYEVKYYDGSSKKFRIDPLTDIDELGRLQYEKIIRKIDNSVADLSISPIDVLIHEIEKIKVPEYAIIYDEEGNVITKEKHESPNKFYTVGECTGRNKRIDYAHNPPMIRAIKKDVGGNFKKFNNGKYDVLLINQTGSTGEDAHASAKFADTRQRVLISLQGQLDINIEQQIRGRINRSGQITERNGRSNMPRYVYLSSTIPSEKRLMIMLKGKLKSLDASTSGNQNNNENSTKVEADFFNKYGDKIVIDYINENDDFYSKIKRPLHSITTDRKGNAVETYSPEDAANKVTARVALLSVAEQNEFYTEIIENYVSYVSNLKRDGKYDLEIDFLPLNAKKLSTVIDVEGDATSKNPFVQPVYRCKYEIDNLKKPLSKEAIEKQITNLLGEQRPEQYAKNLLDRYEAYITPIYEAATKKYTTEIDELSLKSETETKKLVTVTDEIEKEKIELKLNKLNESIRLKNIQKQKYENKNAEFRNKFKFVINRCTPYKPFKFMTTEGYVTYAICMGVKIDFKKKNPFTEANVVVKFATASDEAQVEYTLTKDDYAILLQTIYHSEDVVFQKESKNMYENWNEIVKKYNTSRVIRYIITGNIIQATSMYLGTGSNKLIKFNDSNNNIVNGILMSKDFGSNEDDFLVKRPIVEAYETLLNRNLGPMYEFESYAKKVRIVRVAENFYRFSIIKLSNQDIYTDTETVSLLEIPSNSDSNVGVFVQSGGDMVGTVAKKNLYKMLDVLSKKFGIVYLEKGEEFIEKEVEHVGKVYKYELTSDFKNVDSHTKLNLINYEKDDNTPFGYVNYSYPLRGDIVINFGLIPYFETANDSIEDWMGRLKNTTIEKLLNDLTNKLHGSSRQKIVEEYKQFIYKYPLKTGNREFVFGNYSYAELAESLYERFAQTEKSFNIFSFIKQLKIELELA